MIYFKTLSFLSLFLAISSHAFTLSSTSSAMKGWSTSKLSIAVNYSDCSVDRDTLNSYIDEALSLWNSVPSSGLELSRGGESSTTIADAAAGTATDTPIILCDPNFETTVGSAVGDMVPAVTATGTLDDQVVYGFLLLNAQSGKGASMNALTATSLKITIAHELGHIFGLGHSENENSLMYYSIAKKQSLNLSQDDMDGISFLYPRDELGSHGVYGCASVSALPPQSGAEILAFLLLMYFYLRFFAFLPRRLKNG